MTFLTLLLTLWGAPPFKPDGRKTVEALNRSAQTIVLNQEFGGWDMSFQDCLLSQDLDKAVCHYRAWFGQVELEWEAQPAWHYTGLSFVRPQ